MHNKNSTKPGLEEVKTYYDEAYYKEAGKHAIISLHLRRLASRLDIYTSQRVLDVACGTGEWLQAVQERGGIPFGIDLSARAIEVCKQNVPNGTFFCGPAEKLPFDDAQFDWITCLGSIEHFVDPEGALREMARVAKRDARFVLLVPNADFLTRRLGLYRGTNQTAAIEDVRTLEQWQALFESAGLIIQMRWKDLHVFSRSWLLAQGLLGFPLRATQALLLALWPLRWQYQIYHLCRKAS
jgi:ubiquinone/menaquinone biosynthesis C-methylase UbiE